MIMESIIIMLLFLLLFAAILCIGMKKKNGTNSLLDKQDTLFLKCMWSIIIIMVHIPLEYQNKIQDLVGSFAYIGVTFFFLASAYGLKHSINNKKGYLNNFYKRFIKLIIPMIIIRSLIILLNILIVKHYTFKIGSFVDAWVIRLIFAYLVFWLFYGLLFKNNQKKADLYSSIIIILYSLLGCIPSLSNIFRWNVEIFGFFLGIVIYNHKDIVRTNVKSVIIVALVSIILGLLYIKYKNVMILGNYLLRIILTVSLNYLSFQIISIIRFGNKVTNCLGKISYETYLIHPGIIAILSKTLTSLNSGLFVVLSIFISLLLAYGINIIDLKILRIFERKG